MKRRIFVSHSSENKEIAEQFCAFLAHLGINNERIFCSSIIGQGINNGEKLNDAVATTIKRSKVIIYLISQNFIKSSYCMEELGVGWYLEQNKKVICYYLVLPDIELSELQGFVNSKIDKFSFINQSDLGLFAENISKRFFIWKSSFSQVSNSISTFLSAVMQKLSELVENREREKYLIQEKLEKEQKLESLLKHKDEIIQKYRDDKETSLAEKQREELKVELDQ